MDVTLLHDKATRGESLSAGEQAQLDAWYAEQDQAEAHLLTATASPSRLATL